MASKAFKEAEARQADEEVELIMALSRALSRKPAFQAAMDRRDHRDAELSMLRGRQVVRIQARLDQIKAERDELARKIAALETERDELEAAEVSEVPPVPVG